MRRSILGPDGFGHPRRRPTIWGVVAGWGVWARNPRRRWWCPWRPGEVLLYWTGMDLGPVAMEWEPPDQK